MLRKTIDIGGCWFASAFRQADPSTAQSKDRRETAIGSCSEYFKDRNDRIDNLVLTRG